jgi:putative ABC transport system permease protein
MPLAEALRLALLSILGSKLRSFFTLLGIIVSVGFLVTVVAVIQGMNAYVKENITGAVIGTNAFQVRRTPIGLGLLSDDEIRQIAKRPRITREDAEAVRRGLSRRDGGRTQSGWPTPDQRRGYRTGRSAMLIFGVTPPYQTVQDYCFAAGEPLAELDVTERRPVVVLGHDVAEKLFGGPERAIGRPIRIAGREMRVKGVAAKKGRVLGQSFDGFGLVPISTFEAIYGRRRTTTVSVKMREADEIDGAMARAQEAMRLSRQLGQASRMTSP